MWMWVADQLVSWVIHNGKNNLVTFYLTCDLLATRHNQYWHKLDFYWQMTHVESTNDVVHLHNMEQ